MPLSHGLLSTLWARERASRAAEIIVYSLCFHNLIIYSIWIFPHNVSTWGVLWLHISIKKSTAPTAARAPRRLRPWYGSSGGTPCVLLALWQVVHAKRLRGVDARHAQFRPPFADTCWTYGRHSSSSLCVGSGQAWAMTGVRSRALASTCEVDLEIEFGTLARPRPACAR